MPLLLRVTGNGLKAVNEKQLEEQMAVPLGQTPYRDLLRLLAAATDQAASGENTFIVLGTTKRVDSLLITLNTGSSKESVFAATLADLGLEAGTLLMPF